MTDQAKLLGDCPDGSILPGSVCCEAMWAYQKSSETASSLAGDVFKQIILPRNCKATGTVAMTHDNTCTKLWKNVCLGSS